MKSLSIRVKNCILAMATMAIIAIIGGIAGLQITVYLFSFLALIFFSRIGLHLNVMWYRKYGDQKR